MSDTDAPARLGETQKLDNDGNPYGPGEQETREENKANAMSRVKNMLYRLMGASKDADANERRAVARSINMTFK
ncbi:hypothetical protein SISNIDRAFT_552270 [Sistotremastrum niveocremeum HHB9708]|uniref:Uncharacterized protein n=1 Tax=Sistotremastrum niveocremeum HHB9708 TaxID=1314777 RepID=A0A164PX03_9AGAM|nr:hypothetical protein SISNIDRAFT_552270 [Sistotremastrum niveocremeum HHB9708]